jgi:hypothetical protein
MVGVFCGRVLVRRRIAILCTDRSRRPLGRGRRSAERAPGMAGMLRTRAGSVGARVSVEKHSFLVKDHKID